MTVNMDKMSIADLNKSNSDAQVALYKKQEVAAQVRKLAQDNGLDISDLMGADETKKNKGEEDQRQGCPKI